MGNNLGPNNNKVIGTIVKLNEFSYKLEFVPTIIGKHLIELIDNDQCVWDKPMVVDVCDPRAVRISTLNNCLQGKKCELNGLFVCFLLKVGA